MVFILSVQSTPAVWLTYWDPRQNGRHVADDVLRCVLFNETVWISIIISLKFVPMCPIDNKSAKQATSHYWNQWWFTLLMHICVTPPHWTDEHYSHATRSSKQGWGQLHNIYSTPTPEVSTPTPTPANLQNINSNSNSRSCNSNSGKSPEYQLQLQLRRFQLQLQFRQISRISTPTPIPEISTPILKLQLQSFKSNPNSISNPINLVQLNYHYPITMWNIVWIKWRYAVDICHVVPNLRSNRSTLA